MSPLIYGHLEVREHVEALLLDPPSHNSENRRFLRWHETLSTVKPRCFFTSMNGEF